MPTAERGRRCRLRLVAWLCALLLPLWLTGVAHAQLAHAQPAEATQAAPRIGVVTMLPGTIFWERFGHNAIVVDDPAFGQPVSYNFGFFDMAEPGFVRRFIRGEMQYQLVALPFAQDLAYYRQMGRGASIQWLNLPPDRARVLAEALAVNALPENARYSYDYFTDNCSTRVRDALDDALGGLLKTRLQSRSQGNSYRSEAVRLASPAGWMAWGFDLGLGPSADRPLSRWEDAFVPMQLASDLRGMALPDGTALVASEHALLPHRLPPEPAGVPRPWWPWLLAGLAAAIALLAARRRWPRSSAAAGMLVWLIGGVLGTLMLSIWLFTDHTAGWANRNLWLLNPMLLMLLPGAWQLLRGRTPGRWFGWLLLLMLVSAIIAVLQLWLASAMPQRNAHWIALLLPWHAGWARAFWPWRSTHGPDKT